MPYPEHDKLARQVGKLFEDDHPGWGRRPWQVQDESNYQLAPFLEWLMNQVEFANWKKVCEDCGAIQEYDDSIYCEDANCTGAVESELIPVRHTIQDWLALYYNVDIAKLNEEKAEILAELRREKHEA